MKLAIVMARAENGVIGNNGSIPWHLTKDFKNFKTVTMGAPMIMGRLTFESLPGILPGREHLVVTQQEEIEGVKCFKSMQDALSYCKDNGEEQAFIIGGARMVEEGYNYADELIITEIHKPFEGDVFMPEFDKNHFVQESVISKILDQDKNNDNANITFDICTYKRV